MGMAGILENVEVKGKKHVKVWVIAECRKLKEIFPKDGSGDNHGEFPKVDIDFKNVDKTLLITGHLRKNTVNTFFKSQNWEMDIKKYLDF